MKGALRCVYDHNGFVNEPNTRYIGTNNLYTSNHSNGSKGNVKNVYWLPEQLFYGTLHTDRH